MAPLRQIVAEADARLAIGAAQTLREVVDRTVQQPRGLTTLLAVFAAIALLLGALGLFGIMSHDVARRTREIGLRLTLGSTRVGVVTMVVREGLVLATAGLALGLALSLGLGRTLESNLYGVTSTDPATWIGVMVCLLITSLVASGLPALRASRVDPIEALRQ
jgi:ABC-type antimicrobial peptide transport system permease subunit